MWKASYRLTLPGDPSAPKAALQGWATVENLSGQDWKDVELTLVSGRPVAFHQALYEAYYVTRPEVPVEVADRLDAERRSRRRRGRRGAARPPLAGAAPAPRASTGRMQKRSDGGDGGAAMSQAGNAEQIEATDAATQVVVQVPAAR